MSQTMMSQKQMKLAIAAQENPEHRFTNLYSLMHWDYWIELCSPSSPGTTRKLNSRDRRHNHGTTSSANYQEEITETGRKSEGEDL